MKDRCVANKKEVIIMNNLKVMSTLADETRYQIYQYRATK